MYSVTMQCKRCKQLILNDQYGTGDKGTFCHECCGYIDSIDMARMKEYILYLDRETRELTNWPGTFRIACSYYTRNNIWYVECVYKGYHWTGKVGRDKDLIKMKRNKQ